MLHQGQWDEAIQTAGDVLNRLDLVPIDRVMPMVVLALVRARRGEREVWPLLEEAIGLTDPTELIFMGPVWEARAEAAWLDGDSARSITEAETGLKAATKHSNPWLVGALAVWIHRAGGTVPAVPVAEPFALELAGRWQAAAACWEQRGCRYEAALARLAGDGPALKQALAAFTALEATPAAAKARAALKALGHRAGAGPRAATRAHPYGLTARQVQVGQLLVQGLSDAQIAAQLYITPATASHHVAAILAKLGVTSRHQAARLLQE
jgi:DNA-binding CsgD family transcriptional regulator